jgi:hypothetical protein
MDKDRKTGDAAKRLWAAVERAHTNFAANRRELGKLFFELRNLYSDRNSGGGRLSSGHGTFQGECQKRGYQPRRVREWVNDHEVELGLRKPADSTAAKRAARRSPQTRASVNDPLGYYVSLLSFEALRSAYKTESRMIHPDLGGNGEQMQLLNDAWERVKRHFGAEAESTCEVTRQ